MVGIWLEWLGPVEVECLVQLYLNHLSRTGITMVRVQLDNYEITICVS